MAKQRQSSSSRALASASAAGRWRQRQRQGVDVHAHRTRQGGGGSSEQQGVGGCRAECTTSASAGRKAGRLQGGRQGVGVCRAEGRASAGRKAERRQLASSTGKISGGSRAIRQGVTTGQQDAGCSTAGAMTGSRTHDDGRTRQGATAKRGATMAGAMAA